MMNNNDVKKGEEETPPLAVVTTSDSATNSDVKATPSTVQDDNATAIMTNTDTDTAPTPSPVRTTKEVVIAPIMDYNTVSIMDSSSSGTGGGEGGPRRRPVTIHRKTLDRITSDAVVNQRHVVPEPRTVDPLVQQGGGGGGGSSHFSTSATAGGGGGGRGGGEEQPRLLPSGPSSRHLAKKYMHQTYDKARKKSYGDWIGTFLPMYNWLKIYQWKTTLLQDMIAGLTVGVMIVPQSMSYAKLAGLPVQYGLYSALVPVYAYSLFGSSRQLAVGPVALISLLLSTGLGIMLDNKGITPENTPNYQDIYITLSIQTSFLVGVCYIVMGVLRLGFVTIFLSHAVISGFTTGAAVIIGMSQLKYIFGYDIARSKVLHELLKSTIEGLPNFHGGTFLVGMLSILTLVGMKHIGKTYSQFKFIRAIGPLTVTVLGIVCQYLFDLESRGIQIVGPIPEGLPNVTINQLTPISDMGQMSLVVISIVIVGFMESISIAKQLATKHKYEIDSSLELIGLGMANLGAGFFQGYPITGSFSRSAVNNDSGAQSGISGMVTATLVGFVLLFLTPVFERLPMAVLAGIVISGVLGLLDYPEAIYLWKVHKFDFGVWMVACLGTVFLGVEPGLAIAVGVSLLLVTYESAYPHTAVLGRLPGTTVYRNIKQYSRAECYEGIVMVRIDAPIYFANTQNIRDKIIKYEQRAEELMEANQAENGGNGRGIRYVILELSPVSHVDTSGLHILNDMYDTYRERGIQLCFSNPSKLVMERFVSSGLADRVGREHIGVAIHDLVNHCLGEMDMVALSTHGSQDVANFEDVEGMSDGDSREGGAQEATLSSNNDMEMGTSVKESAVTIPP